MDSLGPEWRLKLPPIPVVPVSAQKRWNSMPSENHKETAKNKSKETTTAKSRGELFPSVNLRSLEWPSKSWPHVAVRQ